MRESSSIEIKTTNKQEGSMVYKETCMDTRSLKRQGNSLSTTVSESQEGG
ncbi:MAG: hypothetical protein HQK97_00575 [Nitrospirae bacterium]|nr:hypothetical protein [Nitrospirota bacterium]